VEQELPTGLGEWQIAKFIEDDEVHSGEVVGESGSTRTPIPAQGGQQSGDCGQQVMAG
jgi:hypothetical protein